mgnify:CR=1 FL=1|nr:BspA family leucine-rich repeat surface protein [uncultured Halomonas sp.]
MKIKKIFIMLGMVGFVGVSSYAMAQNYVYRNPLHGVKASTNLGSVEDNVGGEETPESNLSKPSNFIFSENNDQLSGNVGDTGTVTIYDELGNQIGQTTSDSNGDFIVSIDPIPEAGTVLEVEVDSGSETLTSNITVPEIETDVACYDPDNIGKVGTYSGCMGMLIVDRGMLDQAVSDETYAIDKDGVSYTFADSEYNIFTGQVTDMLSLFMNETFSDDLRFNGDINYWDTSNVTEMGYMFYRNYAFNTYIGDWDTSKVTRTSYMFSRSAFNQPLAGWNTSNMTDMTSMFARSDFNQPIGNWNTSSATIMSRMFEYTSFNQDISGWDLSNVTDISAMFNYNTSFNQDISTWNTSQVSNMASVFSYSNFNRDISAWDTSKVSTMRYMFRDNTAFNQDLSEWCVSRDPSIDYFDDGATSWTLPKPVFGTCPRGEDQL